MLGLHRVSALLVVALFSSSSLPHVYADTKSIEIAGFYAEPYVSDKTDNQGFLYEIVKGAFAEADYQANVRIVPKKRGEHELESGQVAALFPTMKIDPEHFIYSDSLFTVHEAILERSDAKALDAKSSPKSSEFAWDSDSVYNMIDMVNSGRKKAALVDPYVTAQALIGQRSPLIPNLKITHKATGVDYFVAFAKADPQAEARLKAFNDGLAKYKSGSQYQVVLEKYGYQTLPRDKKIATIAVPDFYDVRILKELSKDFLKDKSGLEFRWYLMNEDLLRRRVSTSLLLKEWSFDAFGVEPGELFIHRGVGPIQPFDEDLAKALKPEDLFPPIRYGVEFEKKIYAVPYRVYSNVTFYRKDLFDAKNLKMPASPTFEELTNLARQLHDPSKGVAGFCMRGTPGINENMALIRNLLASADPDALGTILQPDVDNPTWLKVVRSYSDVMLESGPEKSWTLGYAENLQLFKDGKCAIWPDISVAAGEIFDARISKVATKTALTEPPRIVIDEEKRLVSYRGVAVSSFSDKKRPLQEFLVWTLSQGFQDAVVKKYGWIHLPQGIRPSLFQSAEYRKAAPFAKAVQQSFQKYQFKNPVFTDPVVVRAVKEYYGMWPTFCEIFGKNVSEILQLKKSAKTAMQDSQRKAKAVYYQSRNQMQKKQ